MAETRREEAKAHFENMKNMCEVRKAIGCTKCGNCCDMAIECIDRVTELELRNTELSHRVEALDLLLDWAIECNFDFDSLGSAYDEFKGKLLDDDGYKESMIKIAECYIEEYGDERCN